MKYVEAVLVAKNSYRDIECMYMPATKKPKKWKSLELQILDISHEHYLIQNLIAYEAQVGGGGTGGSFAQFYNLAEDSHTAVTDMSTTTHPMRLLMRKWRPGVVKGT